MGKTLINTPFGPWFVKDHYIVRFSGSGFVAGDCRVVINPNYLTVHFNDVYTQNSLLFQASNLTEAVQFAERYIEENFEVEKTTEQKLAEALAEIDSLKLKLHIMPLAVGTRVRVIRKDDDYYQRVLPILNILPFAGKTHYSLCEPSGGIGGLYLRSEIEVA